MTIPVKEVYLSENGEDHLSGWDRQLWDFVFYVLMKFQCPIMFKQTGPDCRFHLDQLLIFFVPKGRDDVVEYVKQEWEAKIRIADNSNVKKNGWFWSTYVHIYVYDGPNMHIEAEDVRRMSQNMLLYLKHKMANPEEDIKPEHLITTNMTKH